MACPASAQRSCRMRRRTPRRDPAWPRADRPPSARRYRHRRCSRRVHRYRNRQSAAIRLRPCAGVSALPHRERHGDVRGSAGASCRCVRDRMEFRISGSPSGPRIPTTSHTSRTPCRTPISTTAGRPATIRPWGGPRPTCGYTRLVVHPADGASRVAEPTRDAGSLLLPPDRYVTWASDSPQPKPSGSWAWC